VFEIVERILAALIILALLTLLIILAFPVSAPTPGPARTTTEVKPTENRENETRVVENKPVPVPTPKTEPKAVEPKSTEPKSVEAPKSAERLPETKVPVIVEQRRPTTNLQAKTDSERVEEVRVENRPRVERVETARRDPAPPRRRRRLAAADCAGGDCCDGCEGCAERRPRIVERRRYAARERPYWTSRGRDRPYWAQQHQPYWTDEPVPAGTCPD
jgi:hypothetical protein